MGTYEGFCDGNIIIVNLSTYLSKLRTEPPLSFFEGGNEGSFKFPRGLLHEMVVTVTHELAHLLESGGGHGPSWRDRICRCCKKFIAILSVAVVNFQEPDGRSAADVSHAGRYINR